MKAVAVGLLISLTGVAVATVYLGEITCDDTASIPACTEDNPCTFTCPSGCSDDKSPTNIFGTRYYTYNSAICRAAIHDYRMSTMALGMNVTISRTLTDDLKKYLPTIQRDIASREYGAIYPVSNAGYFEFLTLYIIEDIVDVATMNFNSMYTDNFDQQCIQSGTKSPTTFQFYIPSSTNYKPSESASGTASGIKWYLSDRSWTGSRLQPGGYWCNLANNTYSNVMSLAMASDADFQNDQWTLTKSIKQNAVIHFTPTQPPNGSIEVTWKKDQKSLYSFPNMVLSNNETGYYLEIDDLQVGDGGVYSLEIKGRTDKQAVMRLIVRRCRDTLFGSNCFRECPTCQNGGICHDVMGTCICAPGFYGTNCENSCEKGFFGQNCALVCPKGKNGLNVCKGAVICLPDPFGCTCAAGYSGPNCDQEDLMDLCQSDSDCPSDHSCQTTDQGIKDCVAVCMPTSCGPNAKCMGALNAATCQCNPGFIGDASDVNTGCQANSGVGAMDCDRTLDQALQNAVQSNSFNPILPITMKVNLGSGSADLSMIRVFNLKNLRRTGTCTMTKQLGYSIDETMIGATNIVVTGYLSNYGLLGNIIPSGKPFLRVNIQSFNSMLKIKIPTDSVPTLLAYKTLQLYGVQVTVAGGSENVNQLLNHLIEVAQRSVPNFFVKMINFILFSMFAMLVQKLS